MRYLLILFFLSSCYGPKTAQKQLDKAYAHFPEIVAKNSSKLFPCDYSTHSIDSSAYFDFQTQIEAINDFYSKAFIADTIKLTDTQTIQVYRDCDKVVTKYKTLIKQSPVLIDTIKVKDNAEVDYYKYELEKMTNQKNTLNSNYIFSIKCIIWLLIIIIIFLLYQYLSKW